ncbi:hypothetical protein EON81_19455 [bacterium]|nr:MAG: hypothetical protein EON81_19455 [bacterium]
MARSQIDFDREDSGMTADLPRFVVVERDALIAEIYGAFADVDREGGVSWSEAMAIDNYEPPEVRQAARDGDSEDGWRSLVDDPAFTYHELSSEWSFLDSIGFRYYLPVFLIKSVRAGWIVSGSSHLIRRTSKHPGVSLLDENIELLSMRQQRCVRRFLEYLDVVGVYLSGAENTEYVRDALESYWINVPES